MNYLEKGGGESITQGGKKTEEGKVGEGGKRLNLSGLMEEKFVHARVTER